VQTINKANVITLFVVGGTEAAPGMFPWTASLQYRDEEDTGKRRPARGYGPRRDGSNLSHNCGGSLVSSRWPGQCTPNFALHCTALHCTALHCTAGTW
jgi:hypothetical protein